MEAVMIVFSVAIFLYCVIGIFLMFLFTDEILKALPRPEWSLGVDYEMRILVLWPIYVFRTILVHRRKAKENDNE